MDDANATFAALGQFNNTLVYRRSAPADALQSDLAVIAEFDREAERQSKRWGGRAALGAVGAILCMFGAIFTGANGLVFLAVPLGVCVAGGVVTAIVSGVKYLKWSRRDIENRRYQLLQELIRHLACDMAPDAPFDVELNGNHYHKPEYLTSGTAGPATSYRIPWLSLSGQFLDGHRFQVTATQLVKRKERRKRKYVKVKEAAFERVEVEVRCKPQKFARWDELPYAIKQQPLSLPLLDWDLQVSGDRVKLSGAMSRATKVTGRSSSGSLDAGNLSAPAVLGLFVLLYRALAEVRK